VGGKGYTDRRETAEERTTKAFSLGGAFSYLPVGH